MFRSFRVLAMTEGKPAREVFLREICVHRTHT